MQRNKSITRYKQKLLLFLSVLFIALILQPKQTVHATTSDSSIWASLASAIVNSTHDNNSAGTSTIHNGVSIDRTGYLAYMVDKESGAPTSEAKAFYAGSNWISGSKWIVSSRHGGLNGGGGFTAPAPWGKPWIPPATKGAPLTSLEPQIKEWFRTKGGGFVLEEFPANHSNFVADTEVLVLETIMNVQFSESNGSLSPAEAADRDIEELGGRDDVTLANSISSLGFDALVNQYFNLLESNQPNDASNFMQNVRDILKQYLISYYSENGTGDASSRTYHGDPVIGTVPNLLAYDQWNTTVFDSYLNNGAPNAEKISYSEAGFTAYSGSGKMSDADVMNYGVAMMIIHCKDPAQTTCNEPSIPSPHEPPKESEGKVTIVKSYRTKDPTGALIDDGTYSLGDLGTQILIENEQVYQVIGWKTSTTTNTGISSINWNPPSSVVQQGTTPKQVTLQPTETCLYVLLEKVEEEEVEEKEWNYRLSESSITRTVWFSNPDRPLDNMSGDYKIDIKPFQWKALGHANCYEHLYYGPCLTNHEGDHTSSCPKGCPSTCNLPSPHIHEKACESHHYWNCGSRDCTLNPLNAKCAEDNTPSDWNWIDKTLNLSINNTLQESYPDILATKEGWNEETQQGGIVKYHHTGGPVERQDKYMITGEDFPESGGETGWDYVCILMRGKDKLTLAEWQNYGQGNNAANNANDDLRDASSSGFTVANTDSGTRKTTDYYETFNTTFGLETDGVENEDNYTTIEAKEYAKDEDGKPIPPKCKSDRGVKLLTPLSVNNIVVKVETYSGTASEHKNDTTCDDRHLTHDLPDYNTSSGRMVKSGGIISFTPYIEMKYDTLEPPYDKTAYVLSEFTSQITPNDYGELSWNKTTDDNLSLISAQWSTHADACKDWGADNVLPGGATLSLNIKKDARQEVAVTTWQCILEGTGKTHVEKTGGSYGNLTRENAVSAHQSFVATVQAALESTNVQQYVEKNPNKSDAFGGLEVNPGVNISSLGTGAQTASIEEKYYFKDDNTDSPSNEGDLDVNNLGTSQETYTFFACTHGHIHLSIGNTSPKISECNCGAYPIAKNESIGKIINDRTLIINKLEAALEQGTGSDGTIHTGPKWYNEAFDGITVIMQQTILEVGYNDPPERSSVLDPKLTPKQTSQKSLFSKYFLSQFKTQDHSTYYNEPYIMGEFKNAKVKLKDMDYIFHSRKFWIPNATTQDLH